MFSFCSHRVNQYVTSAMLLSTEGRRDCFYVLACGVVGRSALSSGRVRSAVCQRGSSLQQGIEKVQMLPHEDGA
jgi:hypothetical protein